MDNLIDDGIKWHELMSLIQCGHTLTFRNVENFLSIEEGNKWARVDLYNDGFTHSILRDIAGWSKCDDSNARLDKM